MDKMEKNRKTYPLKGKGIVVTREKNQAEEFVKLLLEEKACPILFPVIAFKPLEVDWNSILPLSEYHWIIFTSVNGVKFFFEKLESADLSFPKTAKVAAIGPATAKKLQELGINISLMPDRFVAEGLLEKFGNVKGLNILIPRAKVARDMLPDELKKRGAKVDVLAVYETFLPQKSEEEIKALKHADVITFTSPSTVVNFLKLTGNYGYKLCKEKVVASIGPVTTDKANELGIEVHITASEYSIPGLIKALKKYFQKRSESPIV